MNTAMDVVQEWMVIMMNDYIKRENALSTFSNAFYAGLAAKIKAIPSEDVAPVRHEEDGTLWVTVRDCETVGRVIVKNEQGHFCRVFYMGEDDEEPVRHGRWELNTDMAMHCSCCGELFRFDDKDECLDFMEYAKYCIACGAKMDEGDTDEIDRR